MLKQISVIFRIAIIIIGVFVIAPSAEAATSTICSLGCDYTTLNDAVNADLAGQDTFILSTGYSWLFPPESNVINLPDDTILACDPGVTFGDDAGPSSFFSLGSNNVIRDCSFENTRFDASGKTQVSWLNNTFSELNYSDITLTLTDGFEISGNTGLHHLQIQNADNGLISDNTIDCRFGSNCIGFYTAGGGPFDYSDPADVPNNVVITNNTITNHNIITGGDFVQVTVGLDIEYTSNTLQSVETTDNFITMMTVQNAEVLINGNYFFYPPKPPASTNGTWALNVRVTDDDTTMVVENNTFVGNPDVSTINGDSCLGVFDDGLNPGIKQIDIQFRYNLCYNTNPAISDNGISLGYNLGTANVQLIDDFNGFFNVDQVINDNTGTYTDLSGTVLLSDPVLRTENANPADDSELAPMSRYLDINGTRDIGAFGAIRTANYTIDDDCVVDYLICHSNNSAILNQVLRDDDIVTIAAGTYPGVSISGPLSNITITGAGATTIFDGELNYQSALSLAEVSSSTISDLRLINSTDTTVTTVGTTLALLSFGGNDYDDSDAFGGPAGAVYFIYDLACNLEIITADNTILAIDGMTNINAGIADAGGAYVTVMFPEDVADNLGDAQNNICGGVVPFTHFIEDMFVANGDSTYTYNPTNLANQGITLMAGMTNPPAINTTVARGYFAGLRLDQSSNNSFENLLIEDNDLGIAFINGSNGNTIEGSTVSSSNAHDIISNTSGVNDLLDTTFLRTNTEIEDGTVRVRYYSTVQVVDALLNPLENVDVNISSTNALINQDIVTDLAGFTPPVDTLAYLLTTSSIAITNGNYNPFSISVDATSTYQASSTLVTVLDTATYQIILSSAVAPVPLSSGTGGIPYLYPENALNGGITTPMTPGATIHTLVKLRDDGNPVTQEDSTVYYIGADNKRHAFPNPSVYASWYCDFSQVKTISAKDLASYQLGKNITYRPGFRLVKFLTNPNVYIVQPGAVLRPIKDESSAQKLFGSMWAKQVSDIQDTFYNDYLFGEEIAENQEITSLDLSPTYPSGEMSIAGYQDIRVPSSSFQCGAISIPSTLTQPGSSEAKSWPFSTIPLGYQFVNELSSSSEPSTAIRYLQEFLAYKGSSIYPEARITGNYGELTTKAVKNYQKSKNISQTGILGPLTRAAINQELNALH